MSVILPIAITILRCEEKYLFLRRNNPPYEGLLSLVGGKINPGEHVVDAAVREIMEETDAPSVENYSYRGMVSERLLGENAELLRHFLIFVGHAEIETFSPNHREGELALFTVDEIRRRRDEFLPSDWYMFNAFRDPGGCGLYEAEIVHNNGTYTLNYYRESCH